ERAPPRREERKADLRLENIHLLGNRLTLPVGQDAPRDLVADQLAFLLADVLDEERVALQEESFGIAREAGGLADVEDGFLRILQHERNRAKADRAQAGKENVQELLAVRRRQHAAGQPAQALHLIVT